MGTYRVIDRDQQDNGIEPFAYFKPTLTAIASGHPKIRIDDLLPRNFTPSR